MQYSHKILEKIGLSQSEIQAYLAGLKLGPTLASTLAKEAKLSRPLVYHLLESLEAKGLVSKLGPKHGRFFRIEPPSRLKSILERRRKELEKIEQQLDKVAVELESLYSPRVKPSRLRFYEGIEGLKNVAQETLSVKNKELLALVPIENVFTLFEESFLQYWASEREKRQIKSRGVWSKSMDTMLKNQKLQQLRISPKDFVFPSTIVIYDNRVAVFSSPQEQFAFVVESDEYAQTMRALFEQLWKQCRRNSTSL